MGFNKVSRLDDRVMIRNVIVSVYDKTGLEAFVASLLQGCPGVRFYATGGSYAFLADTLGERAGAHLIRMSDYTGQPEMKGGLVKTLDWKIYLGLLAEPYDADHEEDLEKHGALAFDMVIGNLYPFEAAAARAASFEEARQHIDIGGPSLLRAAAKNFLRVAPVCAPELYAGVAEELLRNRGSLALSSRARLAAEVFGRQSSYDAAIARYFSESAAALLPASYS
jgi:phosphoribosylaminoimidazolecarboxamide formyltransferase / IMP cyclohydrolase